MTKPHDPIVPADFEAPTRLVGEGFVLEPLGPQHNERDYAAWTSSFAHPVHLGLVRAHFGRSATSGVPCESFSAVGRNCWNPVKAAASSTK